MNRALLQYRDIISLGVPIGLLVILILLMICLFLQGCGEQTASDNDAELALPVEPDPIGEMIAQMTLRQKIAGLIIVGLEETSVTTYGGDGSIDVRGTLNAENLSRIDVAVQAKRWKGNVGPKVVRELRGSLKIHEHGIVITPSDFTPSAKKEADEWMNDLKATL